jgi:hypothetical protein
MNTWWGRRQGPKTFQPMQYTLDDLLNIAELTADAL